MFVFHRIQLEDGSQTFKGSLCHPLVFCGVLTIRDVNAAPSLGRFLALGSPPTLCFKGYIRARQVPSCKVIYSLYLHQKFAPKADTPREMDTRVPKWPCYVMFAFIQGIGPQGGISRKTRSIGVMKTCPANGNHLSPNVWTQSSNRGFDGLFRKLSAI